MIIRENFSWFFDSVGNPGRIRGGSNNIIKKRALLKSCCLKADPSLPQRGRQYAGGTPLTPHCFSDNFNRT
jgi:hypothetical protein